MNTSLKAYLSILFGNYPASLRAFFATDLADFMAATERALETAMHYLEEGAVYNSKLDERALTHQLTRYLASGGLVASNESYSKGHVDITIVHHHVPSWIFLGECKIYNGPQYHIDGCGQILQRYMTGRAERAFCLDFVQNPNIEEKMLLIRSHMDEQRPHQQVDDGSDHYIRWSFVTEHIHSSGARIKILHLGCNLFHRH